VNAVSAAAAATVNLGLALLSGPLLRHRDRDEQQPHERASHSGAPQEEVMNILWRHAGIFPQ
jgi:hypothetical protein